MQNCNVFLVQLTFLWWNLMVLVHLFVSNYLRSENIEQYFFSWLNLNKFVHIMTLRVLKFLYMLMFLLHIRINFPAEINLKMRITVLSHTKCFVSPCCNSARLICVSVSEEGSFLCSFPEVLKGFLCFLIRIKGLRTDGVQ